jgi:hypothetical protein
MLNDNRLKNSLMPGSMVIMKVIIPVVAIITRIEITEYH